MPPDQGTVLAKLGLLGLTDNEAKVYWAIARLGTSKASDIQRATGLHRPEIYRVILKLIARQLVEETLDRPKRYRCQDVEQAIKRLSAETLSRYQTISDATDWIIRDFKKLQSVPAERSPQVRIISGVANLRKSFAEAVTSSENEIQIMVPKASMQAATKSQIAQLIQNVQSKKLNARVILELDEANVNISRRLSKSVEVRHYTPIPVYVWITDNQRVAVGLSQTSLNTQDGSALLTSYPAYVKIIKEFFEAAWRLSTPLTTQALAMTQPLTHQTRVIWGREEMSKATDDWPVKAKKRILEISTRHGPNRILQRYGKAYAEASQRGVKVQILCSMDSHNRRAVRELNEHCEVRHVDSSFGLGVAILDESAALIHYINPDTPELTTSNTDIAVYLTDAQLVQDLSHMFEFIWRHATPIHRVKT